MAYQLGPPPANPLARLLAGVVAALALIGAFFFGFFVLLIVIGLGLVAGPVFWVRLWWLKRQCDRGCRCRNAVARNFLSTTARPTGDATPSMVTTR